MNDLLMGHEGRGAAPRWAEGSARRALDDLFENARQYREGPAYMNFLDFMARFKTYSPFNAALIHAQLPGARFVATASLWLKQYDRRIRRDARAIAILRPGGPIMFVFDVSGTEPVNEDYPKPLPKKVTNPFQAGGNPGQAMDRTVENAKRDGVDTCYPEAGTQLAGRISLHPSGRYLHIPSRAKKPASVRVPVRYIVELNRHHDKATQYATLTHELAHLYCGHLGSPNKKWWPDRLGVLDKNGKEFEAESVSYLVCKRLGVKSPSDEYLSGYLRDHSEAPVISVELVCKAAGLIEAMGERRLPFRAKK